jgi:formylglycine-generating enzyme required for sulfatase activity
VDDRHPAEGTEGSTRGSEGGSSSTEEACEFGREGCACGFEAQCNQGLVCEDGQCLTNLVMIPAGPFLMGCNATENRADCEEDAQPQQLVELSTYWIEKTEVTQRAYARCVEDGGCTPPIDVTECGLGSRVFDPEERPDIPVVCVEWEQAAQYCAWLGRRLPSEAEWEKAGRGTDGREYPWGSSPPPSCELTVMADVNVEGGVPGCGTGGMLPVGSRDKDVSPYGVMDLLGSVSEWTDGWYAPYPVPMPKDPRGPETGTQRVERGEAFATGNVARLRLFRRVEVSRGTDTPYVGFRCASD